MEIQNGNSQEYPEHYCDLIPAQDVFFPYSQLPQQNLERLRHEMSPLGRSHSHAVLQQSLDISFF